MMKRLYQTLLDTVFPRTAYEEWLDQLDSSFVQKHCPPGTQNNLPLGIRPLFAYKDQHIGALIHQAKFFRNHASVRLIAETLCLAIYEEYRASADLPHIFITWIPARRARLRHYGYCQGMLLAKTVSKKLVTIGIPSTPIQFLCRRFAPFAREQKLLSRKKRLERRNPFLIARKKCMLLEQLSDKPIHIWIIDDVATTGFTIDMARETLFRNAPRYTTISIHCLAFAH